MTISSQVLARLLAGSALLLLAAALLVPRFADAQERTLLVPAQHPDLEAAIAAAAAGDVIVLDAGVYAGGVDVPEDKDGITIRGVDRNRVILDGEHERANAIRALADGVTMENMTARNFTANGFYWRSVERYHGRYLTAHNIGLYGIYAFDSRHGVFEHSYASGSADASFYIGQCHPCDAVIRDVVAEHSALGYSGTNSGGNLVITDSVWRLNGSGILPNSLDSQDDPPQRETTIRGNDIVSNGNLDTPAAGLTGAAIGIGVGIAGGVGNVVEANTVTDNSKYGVVVFPMPGGENVYPPQDNVVRANTVSGSGEADLAIAAGSGPGNCFEDNTFDSSAPPMIEDGWPCDDSGLGAAPGGGDPTVAASLANDFAQAQAGASERPDYRDMPAPPPQENMPGAAAHDPAPQEPPPSQPGLPATGGGMIAGIAGLGLVLSGLRLARRS